MTNSKKAAKFNEELVKSEILSVAAQCRVSADSAAARYAETKSEQDKRNAQRMTTHATYNELLTTLSQSALKYVVTLASQDIVSVCAESRELKKRLIDTVSAICDSTKMRADSASAFALFAAKSEQNTFRITEIQKEMQHDTTTQASYFVRFLVMFDAATYNKDDKTVTIKREHKLVSDAIAAL